MSLNTSKLLSVTLATACSGLCAGALSFVSFVDVRSFLQHLANKKTDVVVSHFQVWWPNGRDFMVPLIACNIISHATTYFFTKDPLWIATGTIMGMIGPYTAVVLGEDIEKLRSSSAEEVDTTARRFCTLHHARLIMAATGFGMSLFGMGKQFENSAK
jgi:hypothetical protein